MIKKQQSKLTLGEIFLYSILHRDMLFKINHLISQKSFQNFYPDFINLLKVAQLTHGH